MTAVKICGLTRPEDVTLACSLGAAYVGFNFAERSPRRISIERSRELAGATAAGVRKVGVFRDEPTDRIEEAMAEARLDLIQLHRQLTRQDLQRFGVPVIGVLAASRAAAKWVPAHLLEDCHAVLLDSSEGTGARLDLEQLRGVSFPIPFFVAGGLDADTVGAVIRALAPSGVDVASGVESEPGKKDRAKLTRLFEAVRKADEETQGG